MRISLKVCYLKYTIDFPESKCSADVGQRSKDGAYLLVQTALSVGRQYLWLLKTYIKKLCQRRRHADTNKRRLFAGAFNLLTLMII